MLTKPAITAVLNLLFVSYFVTEAMSFQTQPQETIICKNSRLKLR